MRDASCWSVGLFVVALAGKLLDWVGPTTDRGRLQTGGRAVRGQCRDLFFPLSSGKVAGGSREDESG